MWVRTPFNLFVLCLLVLESLSDDHCRKVWFIFVPSSVVDELWPVHLLSYSLSQRFQSEGVSRCLFMCQKHIWVWIWLLFVSSSGGGKVRSSLHVHHSKLRLSQHLHRQLLAANVLPWLLRTRLSGWDHVYMCATHIHTHPREEDPESDVEDKTGNDEMSYVNKNDQNYIKEREHMGQNCDSKFWSFKV